MLFSMLSYHTEFVSSDTKEEVGQIRIFTQAVHAKQVYMNVFSVATIWQRVSLCTAEAAADNSGLRAQHACE